MCSLLTQHFYSNTSYQVLKRFIHHIRFSSYTSKQQIKTENTNEEKFCYTLPNGNLTFEQRKFYEDNGFIIIKKLISSSILERIRKRFEDICTGKLKIPYMTIVQDVTYAKSKSPIEEKTINRIQDITFDEEFFKYCCLPELIQYVENFTGPNIMAMHTMLINKPPDAGKKTSRHPLHQDLYFLPVRPANRIVCAWTAMEHTYRHNGCLIILPGTHKGNIEQHVYPNWKGGNNKMYLGIENFDIKKKGEYIEMWEGDTIFFHPLVIHGSGRNRTSGFRKAISCHFTDSSCHYIKSENFQESMSNEFRDAFRKRTGYQNATFIDLWKDRSRLVQGERIHL